MVIRPVRLSEMSLIKKRAKEFWPDNENLGYAQFVVAELVKR
jgi:hypothetical protein